MAEATQHTASVTDGAPAPRTTAACLCLAFDASRPTDAVARVLLDEETAVVGRGDAFAVARRMVDDADCVVITVPDRTASSKHVRLRRLAGRWRAADAGSKNGTFRNGTLIIGEVDLADGDVLEIGSVFLVYRAAAPIAAAANGDVVLDEAAVAAAPAMATLSAGFAQALLDLTAVARADLPILLQAESGAGKEVLARSIHRLSGRGGPFVAVNCGALPDTLVETELFGYKKGAFSGALDDRPGLIRSADGGTLLLDEIGDLPAASQAVLLRVLQEREVMPVGGTRPLPVDVRVVAATHRDLGALVAAGEFRADLLARLSGYALTVPPLRARHEDLGLLIGQLLRRAAPERAAEVTFTRRAARALFLHAWPANVRELQQCLIAALALSGGAAIDIAHLPPAVRDGAPTLPPPPPSEPQSDEQRARRDEIVAALTAHGGNVAAAARALGKARPLVHRWIKQYGIDLDAFRK